MTKHTLRTNPMFHSNPVPCDQQSWVAAGRPEFPGLKYATLDRDVLIGELNAALCWYGGGEWVGVRFEGETTVQEWPLRSLEWR